MKYIDQQFGRLKNIHNYEACILKIMNTSKGEETNWLGVSKEQLEEIKQILLKSDLTY